MSLRVKPRRFPRRIRVSRARSRFLKMRVAPTRSFAGRLINVSTRAYVGSGYQTLTGGFVVTGEAAKTVLLRAPGPTIGLPPFNVPGALVDPVLRINRIVGGAALTIGTNDDWGLPAANGSAVAAAGQTTGAFVLGNGSRDAALVLALEPGAYTAEVSGETLINRPANERVGATR